ncbi:MAG: ABC transporter substrate-binding protein [Ignisphaera sp.]|uniref:Solute-binding protein family 5 domain-containing protein n=1 Tax=Ignisphaera aggregans TaxID=334771 RepID=A0A832CCA2_9CREN
MKTGVRSLLISLILLLLTINILSLIATTIHAQAPRLEFIVRWTKPAVVNHNPFAPGNPVGASSYLQAACRPPLYLYSIVAETFLPWSARDFKLGIDTDGRGYLELVIRNDLRWFNGRDLKPFTSRDVWTFFMIQWKIQRNYIPWLDEIRVLDDYTIRFYFNKSAMSFTSARLDKPEEVYTYEFVAPFNYIGIRVLLTQYITTPYDIFGKWAEQVALMKLGEVPHAQLREELQTFQLDEVWCYGPYWVDPTTLTDTGVLLKKNPYYPLARNIVFEEVQVHYTRATDQDIALERDGRVTFQYSAAPLDLMGTIQADAGIPTKYFASWVWVIHGLWFNAWKYPLNITEVRQALTMLINRTRLAEAYPLRLPINDYITGLGDSNWLPDWIKNNLYDWSYNPQKAYQLLEKAGFKKGSDGKWYDTKTGQPLSLEVACGSYTDWIAFADNLKWQWEQHGVVVTTRSFDVSLRAQVQDKLNYDVLIETGPMVSTALAEAGGGFLNLRWAMFAGPDNLKLTKVDMAWPVPLRNGSTIYVSPYVETQKLQASLPFTPEWWDSLSKLVWFWNYYIFTGVGWKVIRTFAVNVDRTNIMELIGPPDGSIDTGLGYKLPYYEGMRIWWFGSSPTGFIAPYLFQDYGILKPTTKRLWPPETLPKPTDIRNLIPSEYKVRTLREVVDQLLKLIAPPTTTTPTPTPSPTPTTTPTMPTTTPTTVPPTTTTPTPTPSPTPSPTEISVTTITITTISVVERTISSVSTALISTTVRETDWTITMLLTVVLFVVGFAVGWFLKKR